MAAPGDFLEPLRHPRDRRRAHGGFLHARARAARDATAGRCPTGRPLTFLSHDPDQHHQLVLVTGRPPGVDYNVVNQISFKRLDAGRAQGVMHARHARGRGSRTSASSPTATPGRSTSRIPRATASSCSSTRPGTRRSRSPSPSTSRPRSRPSWPRRRRLCRNRPGFVSRGGLAADAGGKDGGVSVATKILLGPKLPESILDIARSLTPAGFELAVADQGTPEFYEAGARTPSTTSARPRRWVASSSAPRPSLRLVQLTSAGYDRVDIEAARKAKVPVANNGGANAIAVSEHTIMLMLAVLKRLVWHPQQRGGRQVAGGRPRRVAGLRAVRAHLWASWAWATSARRSRGAPGPST